MGVKLTEAIHRSLQALHGPGQGVRNQVELRLAHCNLLLVLVIQLYGQVLQLLNPLLVGALVVL